MRTDVTLLVLQLLYSATAHKFSPAADSLVSCVKSIVQRHFSPDRQIMVLSAGQDNGHLDLLLQKINEASRWSLQVFRTGLEQIPASDEDDDKIGSYVIFIDHSQEDGGLVGQLVGTSSWNHLACFLVVVMVRWESPEQQALSVVQQLWNNARALNVVVLVQLQTVFQLYTWFPYQSRRQCVDVTDVVLINEWSPETEEMLFNAGPLCTNKIPNDFQGCPFEVSMPHQAMPELPHVIAFSRLYNFTLVLHFKHDNNFLYDAISESIVDIVFGSSEAVIGGMPLLRYSAKLGQPSFPYYESKFVWYVPCSRPLTGLLAVSRIFSLPLWIATVAMTIFVPAITWRLSNFSPEYQSYEKISDVFYNMWAISMGVSVTKMPRTFRLRVLILTWIYYCFAISTVFQTIFISYLVNPGLGRQIKTLDELIETGMEFGFRDDIAYYYSESPFEIHKKLLDHRKECSKTHLCIQHIINTSEYATVAESWSVDMLMVMNNSNRVCRMNDVDSFPINLVAYFSKGSVLLDTFNKMITSLVETGIISKMDRDRKASPIAHRTGETDKHDEYSAFTLFHLQLAFHALSLGLSLSLAILVLELLHRRFRTGRSTILPAVLGEHVSC